VGWREQACAAAVRAPPGGGEAGQRFSSLRFDRHLLPLLLGLPRRGRGPVPLLHREVVGAAATRLLLRLLLLLLCCWERKKVAREHRSRGRAGAQLQG
jgi:hypothetical protein